MKYPKIPLAQTVITLCKMHNVKHIVISPGSRNAPLTIGFTHDIFFKCYSIVDERCAAFFAMGIAQQIQQPTAVVCTSGSALLNYYPAVSEAYYSRIPLIILSADRPRYLIDIGDGQTINQANVYGAHVFYSANLNLDLRANNQAQKNEKTSLFEPIKNKLEKFSVSQKDIQKSNEEEIHAALYSAIENSGPVHINIPFDEPLYETTDKLTINPKPYNTTVLENQLQDTELKTLSEIWNTSSRKMILVGVLQPNSIELKWLEELAEDQSVIVLTETTSNLHHDSNFPEIDKLIAPLNKKELERLHPEILLTFGGLIVSKKIKQFLRNYQPKHHWHINKYVANDTFFVLKTHLKCSPNSFFEAFLKKITLVKSDYKPYWLKIRNKRRTLHDKYLKTIPFSDVIVFDLILKFLPNKSHLHVGNSSAIRYTQLFQPREDIKFFCNRGTSGIDGSTSTAIGAAVMAKERVTFITGDLSFFYDSNALWNNAIPHNFRIIIVNNNGGGIFRILLKHKNTTNFDEFFETKHRLTAKQLAEMYGFDYYSACDNKTLHKSLNTFYLDSDKPKILEIFTPTKLNDKILLSYFDFIK